MNDLTEHQRDIMIAMLQGKRIEMFGQPGEKLGWSIVRSDAPIFLALHLCADDLRIAPGQENETVRLYGSMEKDHFNNISFGPVDVGNPNWSYIDITPTGFIVGGKLA